MEGFSEDGWWWVAWWCKWAVRELEGIWIEERGEEGVDAVEPEDMEPGFAGNLLWEGFLISGSIWRVKGFLCTWALPWRRLLLPEVGDKGAIGDAPGKTWCKLLIFDEVLIWWEASNLGFKGLDKLWDLNNGGLGRVSLVFIALVLVIGLSTFFDDKSLTGDGVAPALELSLTADGFALRDGLFREGPMILQWKHVTKADQLSACVCVCACV